MTSFLPPLPGGGTSDPLYSLIGKEFTSKNSRQCNCIAWNPTESNFLAAGYEKHRTDYGTLVWDINKAIDAHYQSVSYPSSATLNSGIRPVYEIGLGETTYSVVWFSQQPKSMVCGMNGKHIKIYDLRSPAKSRSSTATKAVYGITLDPFSENRLASYSEVINLGAFLICCMVEYVLVYYGPRPLRNNKVTKGQSTESLII